LQKRFGLLKDAIPGVSRVAALWHPAAYEKRTMEGMLRDTETAAQALGLQLQLVPADSPANLDGAFVTMTREHADAVILLPSPMLYGEHKRIVGLAAKSRLTAIYAAREFVEDGGLMSYGARLPDLFRRVATYVGKILKGANKADLPVEQPTQLELVFNLQTAGTGEDTRGRRDGDNFLRIFSPECRNRDEPMGGSDVEGRIPRQSPFKAR
jgi:putative ABC transport system substrate-binding protein